jgi:hyperpolarization activated cyclic nucleotide-gated potassium channel 2
MAQAMFILELALSMKMVCYPPFEVVIKGGDIGFQMYFIVRGAVEITQKSVRLKILGENSFFGESGLMESGPVARSATVRTLCFTELRELSHEDLHVALAKCPSMKDRIFSLSKVAREQKDGKGVGSIFLPCLWPSSLFSVG